ncbi:MAG: hypothetical protein WA005_09715 [Candidatus Binataceae bacterium]
MSEFRGTLRLSSRAVGLVAFIIGLATVAWVGSAGAQTDLDLEQSPSVTTTPNASFQYSSLTGSGKTITATQVPVLDSKGDTLFKDFTITFSVDANGNPSLASGFPKVTNSPVLPYVDDFKPGKYAGPSAYDSGKYELTVTGPANAGGGIAQWTITQAGSDTNAFPGSGTWYVVNSLASSPIYARLKAANITSTVWSYGLIGSPAGGGDLDWDSNGIIGVTQNGNLLTFASFSDNGSDYNNIQAQITYTRQ